MKNTLSHRLRTKRKVTRFKQKSSDRNVDAGLPPAPFSKTTGANETQNKETLTYSNTVGGHSSSNLHSNQDRKGKTTQSVPAPQPPNAAESHTLILSKLKQPKFFKNRKQSHSKKRSNENESLYEESIKLKIQNNNLKEENKKLKTQILVTEKEVEKRDKLVEEVVMSLNKNLKCSECSLKDPSSPAKQGKLLAIIKSSLTNNLKKQIKDLKQEVTELRKDKMDK